MTWLKVLILLFGFQVSLFAQDACLKPNSLVFLKKSREVAGVKTNLAYCYSESSTLGLIPDQVMNKLQKATGASSKNLNEIIFKGWAPGPFSDQRYGELRKGDEQSSLILKHLREKVQMLNSRVQFSSDEEPDFIKGLESIPPFEYIKSKEMSFCTEGNKCKLQVLGGNENFLIDNILETLSDDSFLSEAPDYLLKELKHFESRVKIFKADCLFKEWELEENQKRIFGDIQRDYPETNLEDLIFIRNELSNQSLEDYNNCKEEDNSVEHCIVGFVLPEALNDYHPKLNLPDLYDQEEKVPADLRNIIFNGEGTHCLKEEMKRKSLSVKHCRKEGEQQAKDRIEDFSGVPNIGRHLENLAFIKAPESYTEAELEKAFSEKFGSIVPHRLSRIKQLQEWGWMTPDEKFVSEKHRRMWLTIYHYTSTGYRAMNPALWYNDDVRRREAVFLSHAIAGLSSLNDSEKFGYDRENKHLKRITELPASVKEKHKEGRNIVYEAFVSTSKRENWAWPKGSDAFLIKGGSSCSYVGRIALYQNEEEVLCVPGTIFKVEKIDKQGKYDNYVMSDQGYIRGW